MATYESRRYNTPVPEATSIADGSVNNTEFQFINTLSSNAQTQITARLPLAGGTMTGDLNFGDNVDANFGAGADLKIYHDGSNSFVEDAGTGRLTLISNGAGIQFNAAGEQMADFIKDGAVELFHNNVKKAETASGGFTVTGAMAATTVTGDGSGLTALNGSNIASGTVADARISALTASKLTGALPAIDGSALTNLPGGPDTFTADGSVGSLEMLCYQPNSSYSDASTSLNSTYSGSLLFVPNGTNYHLGSGQNASQGDAFRGLTISSTNRSGTYRCLGMAFRKSGTRESGNYAYYLPGLFARIS
tara:strand:+ start:2090 stop:3007 length:918 start_codon:yes stop_codon:yes gene_type:complete